MYVSAAVVPVVLLFVFYGADGLVCYEGKGNLLGSNTVQVGLVEYGSSVVPVMVCWVLGGNEKAS